MYLPASILAGALFDIRLGPGGGLCKLVRGVVCVCVVCTMVVFNNMCMY